MPLVSGQVNSKLVTELVTKLKAASEKKEAVEPTLLSEPINPVQVEQLEAKLEELKTNILEASRIEQGVFYRIREMELFESNQKVRKEARTVARRLIQANPNQDQVATSSHRGFLPFRSGKV